MDQTAVTVGQASVSARDGLVGALLHGLAVLDMFRRDRPVVGVADIARQLGVHKSTASRLAATLAVAGYLDQAGEQPGRYRLAAKLAVLGELAASDTELRRAALPHLRDLVQRLGDTGHLGMLEGTEAVTVEVVDGWQTVRMHSWVGKRAPAHCSSMGKVLLAGLDHAEFLARYPDAELAARTPATISSRADLERTLAQVRASGYATDYEELEQHLCCVAAPVFDRSGRVAASISVSGPTCRFTPAAAEPAAATVVGVAAGPAAGVAAGVAAAEPVGDDVSEIIADVRQAARQVSAALGAPDDIPHWNLAPG